MSNLKYDLSLSVPLHIPNLQAKHSVAASHVQLMFRSIDRILFTLVDEESNSDQFF